MKKIIQVKMGEIKISSAPDILVSNGMGSCVGLVLYDNKQKIGGLAHIMLPYCESSKNNEIQKGKYADHAIPFLFNQLLKKGANRKNMWAKMAGGSQMFAFDSENEMVRIGSRNSEKSKELLEQLSIPLIAADVGGNRGRTIQFALETGEFIIKTVQSGVNII